MENTTKCNLNLPSLVFISYSWKTILYKLWTFFWWVKLHMQLNLHIEINIFHVLSFLLLLFTCILYIGYFNLKHSSLKGSGKVGKKFILLFQYSEWNTKDKEIIVVYKRESYFWLTLKCFCRLLTIT